MSTMHGQHIQKHTDLSKDVLLSTMMKAMPFAA
jgi:hypothetical protein